MNTRKTLQLVLFFLVIATGWFLKSPDNGSPVATSQEQGPDVFANRIEVTVLDESGQSAYRIVADSLLHSPNAQRFDLSRPVIEVNRPGGTRWNISSERGQMTDQGDLVWFLGEVNMQRQGSNPLHIQTSDILVKPDEELAETDKAVTVSSALYKIDAIGLKADFRKKLLEFRSRVRGTIHAAG